jgi:hypothetical protein
VGYVKVKTDKTVSTVSTTTPRARKKCHHGILPQVFGKYRLVVALRQMFIHRFTAKLEAPEALTTSGRNCKSTKAGNF